MPMLPISKNVARCEIADEHFLNGPQSKFVTHRIEPKNIPIRLLKATLPPGAHPDPAVSELSLQAFPKRAGHTAFDIGLGRRVAKIESGLMGLAPAETQCDYQIDEPCEILLLNFSTRWLSCAFEAEFPRFDWNDLGEAHENTFHDPTITALITRMWIEYDDEPTSQLLTETSSLAIVTLLLKKFKKGLKWKPELAGDLTPFQVRRIKSIIEERLSDNIPVSDLANAIGLSSFHFIRAFKSTTGYTPYQYVLKRRIVKSCEMLGKPSLSMTQIAFLCGFSSSQHFSTEFKRQMKTTPTTYRSAL